MKKGGDVSQRNKKQALLATLVFVCICLKLLFFFGVFFRDINHIERTD